MSGKGRHLLWLAWRVPGRMARNKAGGTGSSRWCKWLSEEKGLCLGGDGECQTERSLQRGIIPPHGSCLCGPRRSPSLYPPIPHAPACGYLRSSVSCLSHRELCTADWPQCSCDHHQTRGGMSVSVRVPGLCQGAGGGQEEGLFFPTPCRTEPPAS